MKRLVIALLAALAFASFAHAADLPTTKAPEEKPKPNCWASVWDWLNASASDCPISAYGITLYGTIDVNGTYLNQGLGRNPSAGPRSSFILSPTTEVLSPLMLASPMLSKAFL